MLGLPDIVTALSLDNAVMMFGVWVENKLQERDGDQPKYTLDDLLDAQPELPPLDMEVPAWGEPIPDEFRKRALRRKTNKAGLKLLNAARAGGI